MSDPLHWCQTSQPLCKQVCLYLCDDVCIWPMTHTWPCFLWLAWLLDGRINRHTCKRRFSVLPSLRHALSWLCCKQSINQSNITAEWHSWDQAVGRQLHTVQLKQISCEGTGRHCLVLFRLLHVSVWDFYELGWRGLQLETGSGMAEAAVPSLNPRVMRAPEHTPGMDTWGS